MVFFQLVKRLWTPRRPLQRNFLRWFCGSKACTKQAVPSAASALSSAAHGHGVCGSWAPGQGFSLGWGGGVLCS